MKQLSEQVTISLQNAQQDLREALSFASKTEEARINMAISQIMEATEQILSYYENRKVSLQDFMRGHYGTH